MLILIVEHFLLLYGRASKLSRMKSAPVLFVLPENITVMYQILPAFDREGVAVAHKIKVEIDFYITFFNKL